mgnify:CR=1 FL=1
MEKNILRQYDSILKEITDTNRRIQSAKDKLKRMEDEGAVVDSVSGGFGGTQHFKIEGMPTTEYSKQKSILLARKMRLETLQQKLLDMKNDVEMYIYGITDSECRRAAAFRYIDNMGWKKVAEHMGEGYTENGCRMMVDRYLKKN